jgi:hypothetical protein
MPKKANCARCGRPLLLGPGSRPEPICLSCRKAGLGPRVERYIPCRRCGQLMSLGWHYAMRAGRAFDPICGACQRLPLPNDQRTCPDCGFTFTARRDSNGWLRGGPRCNFCQWQAGKEGRAARRRVPRGPHFTDETRRTIFTRDKWICQMPVCLHPDGREISAEPWPSPWSASTDHIIRVADGGGNGVENGRAAHLRCNISAGAASDAP